MGDVRYVWVPKDIDDGTLVQKEVYGPHGGERDRLAELCRKYVWRGVHENKSEIKLREMLEELDTAV